MATRQYNRLTALDVKRAKEPRAYLDGGGLMLQITKAGSKSWVFRWERGGKQRCHGLGPARDVSLAEAREKAAECRRLLREGKDPIAQRAALTARHKTFDECVEAFLAENEHGWKNEKHRQQWRNTLKTYASPVIGALPAHEIDSPLVVKILSPIWREKRETASRLRGRIETVLDWAAVRGYRPKGDNPAAWKGNLKHVFKSKRVVEHHPKLEYPELPAFFADLRKREGIGARALELTILTAARTGEIIGARWNEFDLDAAVWTVPAERMKMEREHRVALSDAAIEVLRSLPRNGAFVFPGRRVDQPISNMTMAKVLKSMGRTDITVHGFRSTFRTWASEKTDHPRTVIELAVAHDDRSDVQRAYDRTDYLDKRRPLMAAWARFCLSPDRKGQVVSIAARR